MPSVEGAEAGDVSTVRRSRFRAGAFRTAFGAACPDGAFAVALAAREALAFAGAFARAFAGAALAGRAGRFAFVALAPVVERGGDFRRAAGRAALRAPVLRAAALRGGALREAGFREAGLLAFAAAFRAAGRRAGAFRAAFFFADFAAAARAPARGAFLDAVFFLPLDDFAMAVLSEFLDSDL
ncbi:MAG: hypothetical protein R2708_11370 [Vicinamibacterales bacterium]